jgi:hypothetical protein
MKRIGAGAVVLGFLLLAGGFAYDVAFAGIPYQDPTPELAARYAAHQEIAGWIGRAGLAVVVVGVGVLLVGAGVRRVRPRG